MNLANKTFRNIQTGQDITIIDSLGDIAILTNGGKLKVSSILDSNLYIEKIDPNSFLSSHHNELQNLADKIIQESEKNESLNKTDYNNDSAIIISSLEDEKEELARKYGISNTNNNINNINKQNEAFDRILNPEQRDSKSIKNEQRDSNTEDPINHIFKNTKRNVDFKIEFNIDERIPRIDFIEMMEDSYESSIIDFLAKEFTNKIIKNPLLIEEKIKEKIRLMVFGKKDVNEQTVDKDIEKVTNIIPNKRVRKTKVKEEKND
jgi:hypothetical protein